ncbi:hypothetical protein [Exiguobacterium sp. s133]|uniref:hypothetical protein n=1 Tax=Exiguobacterium sp. s133 TaxID=2751213 RepID=UPI001BE65138|nr:hypothetical protein [Exiguobacterium sp. s133]
MICSPTQSDEYQNHVAKQVDRFYCSPVIEVEKDESFVWLKTNEQAGILTFNV